MHTMWYSSPLGKILLAADAIGICGLWFDGQKRFASLLSDVRNVSSDHPSDHPFLAMAKQWLDVYFSGLEPDFSVPLHPMGSAFQRLVWKLLETIPYGRTMTYGGLAASVAERLGRSSMSAQAVGGP